METARDVRCDPSRERERKMAAEPKPRDFVTIDSSTGRQTVNIDKLLSSDAGKVYLEEMSRVPTYRIRGTAARLSRSGVVRKKK
jgi:hypothetical protein